MAPDMVGEALATEAVGDVLVAVSIISRKEGLANMASNALLRSLKKRRRST